MANIRTLDPGLKLDLAGKTTYGDYLRLDRLLSAQEPRSKPEHHDELLFIIQHQTSELWMKLLIHELTAARSLVREDRLEPAFRRSSPAQGKSSGCCSSSGAFWRRLPPSEYLEFRSVLGPASGFQSAQYRALEFLLGNKDASALLVYRQAPEVHAWLERSLREPSLYDEFLRHLARRGLPVPPERLDRDFSEPYEPHPGVVAVFRTVYADPEQWWDGYEMAEKLVDVEERFQLWRFRHMMTVQRIIGFKPGTGGSAGVPFLKRALDVRFFPELWDVRTELEAPR